MESSEAAILVPPKDGGGLAIAMAQEKERATLRLHIGVRVLGVRK